MKDVSILTVSRSQKNLESLAATIRLAVGDLDFELICSWNGDEPLNTSQLKEFPFKCIELRPYNFSKNNNRLAELASGRYILFLNDDIALDSSSIANAVDYIAQNPRVGIVGANLRYPNGKLQHAGILIDDTLMPYHLLKGQCDFSDPRVKSIREFPAVTGAFLLIDREEFMQVQFDERCLVAAQDVILCYEYRKKFSKQVVYLPTSSAVHFENQTRKLFDQRTTPYEDIELMKATIKNHFTPVEPNGKYDHIRLRVVTEKPGWIMHRKGAEICKGLQHFKINQDYPDANVHYYINYGYYRGRPKAGLVIANFTHFDPDLHSDKWIKAAREVDHCIAVSEEAALNITRFGIPEEKITVIKVGADVSFKPKMTLGIVGRVYPGGRKGEHLVHQLLENETLMEGLEIVATNDSWGVPVRNFDHMPDFYRSIDYLLVPSLIEGGPVPFMEALACGTLSIAPPIGVIPEFSHIPYKTGDIQSLVNAITEVKANFLARKQRFSDEMREHNWSTWTLQHLELFNRLLKSRTS